MTDLLARLSRLAVPPKGQNLYWQGVSDASSSLSIACLAGSQPRPFVVLTPSQEAAFQIASEIEFFGAQLNVEVFPDLEILPYDCFSPQSHVISSRLKLLSRMLSGSVQVVVVSMRALQVRLPPTEYVGTRTLLLRAGSEFDRSAQLRQLAGVGYRTVDMALEPGDLAVRGSIVDIFPVGSQMPIRIDLLDNEIESLRIFDPETQRSTGHTREFSLVPAKEFPLDAEAVERFKSQWHLAFAVDVRGCPTYQQVSGGVAAEGVECYLPLFFNKTETLFDYLPDTAIMVSAMDPGESASASWNEIESRYEKLKEEPGRPLLPPHRLYMRTDEVLHRLRDFPRIEIDSEWKHARHSVALGSSELPSVEAQVRTSDPIRRLRSFLGNANRRVLITAESAGRLDHLEEFLRRGGMAARQVRDFDAYLNGTDELSITVAPLDRPMWIDEVVVFSESQIFGPGAKAGRRRFAGKTTDPDLAIRNLTELRVGAPVVHIDHGVGRYRGLEHLTVDDCPGEFLLIEYAGGDKLYVPVASLHLISRFTGTAEESAPLDRLGSDRWEKAKKRAASRIRDVAAELLDIYARREASTAYPFPATGSDFYSFCDECEFELTPDQANAVDVVLSDLRSTKAMDRLVCGDVGFGKTEVAMQAAFHVVQSGKQVTILVPTTLLAQQHFDSFQNRFSGWPYVIEVVSRFRSRVETEELRRRVQEGSIDILIGTHRLLHADFQFKDLGLLIVDEEHRFGVADKERLKTFRSSVDVLTLSATPIPRTLNMAVGGIRDLSIIATPPSKRLAIRTFVAQPSKQLMSDALNRELSRGGQAFFVHNEVRSIERKAQELSELVPNARIGVGHGQMPKRALEDVMADFYHRRCNVLVCSTIIESGIDVPNANTIVIERADRFGLAQLHQLRGRVGRSHRQAYAYLLVPSEDAMTADAAKRLDAIQTSGDLGIGFTLALHDLEIRGAGELLGKDQSGQIEAIGFTLYMEMLERTVKAMKLGDRIDLDVPLRAQGALEIELGLPALIPDDYLPDIHMRLVMYKRIAMTEDQEQLVDLRVEMVDRFGMLPDSARNLFRIARLRFAAEDLRIKKISVDRNGGFLDFRDDTPVDPGALLVHIARNSTKLKLTGPSRLRIQGGFEADDARFVAVENVLADLLDIAQEKQEVA